MDYWIEKSLSDLFGLRKCYKGYGRFLIFSIIYPNWHDTILANFNANIEILIEFLLRQYFIVKISFQLLQKVSSISQISIGNRFFIDAAKISIGIVYIVAK